MSKLTVVTDIPDENEIRNSIVEYLVYNHWLVLRINSGAAVVIEHGKRRWINYVKWFVLGENPQTAGVSDLICLKDGAAIAIETKRPGNTPTEAQERFMNEWRRRGGVAIVARSVDDVIKVIE